MIEAHTPTQILLWHDIKSIPYPKYTYLRLLSLDVTLWHSIFICMLTHMHISISCEWSSWYWRGHDTFVLKTTSNTYFQYFFILPNELLFNFVTCQLRCCPFLASLLISYFYILTKEKRHGVIRNNVARNFFLYFIWTSLLILWALLSHLSTKEMKLNIYEHGMRNDAVFANKIMQKVNICVHTSEWRL
jgi:hypothetical protein